VSLQELNFPKINTIITAIEFGTQGDSFSPSGGVDSHVLSNDGHFKVVFPDVIPIPISREHLAN